MSLKKMIDRANELKEEIDSFGEYDREILKKINYKFRLDWNYYSNHMEGGTLTKEETRSVMVGNIDVKGKPLKDVMEMNGHDEIVREILKIGSSEKRISEKRIREIHSAIMFEENPSKKSEIGKWKSESNHLINYKGEKIDFAEPRDVQDAMHKLLNQLNSNLDKYHQGKLEIHPIILASQFHIDFVTIHPFYDGNGRMARILSNLILISCGFPPIIIRENVKENYYRTLADIQVYGGEKDLFYKFIITGVVDSQLLILKAINGEDIDEPDDLDKEIELFKREVEAKEIVGTIKKSNELITELYYNWIQDFFNLFETKHHKFDDLFSENIYSRWLDGGFPSGFEGDYIAFLLNGNQSESQLKKPIESMNFNIIHKGYKRNGLNSFTLNQWLIIKTDEYQMYIGDGRGFSTNIPYSSIPDEKEIQKWVNETLTNFLNELKKKSSFNDKK